MFLISNKSLIDKIKNSINKIIKKSSKKQKNSIFFILIKKEELQ